MIRKHFSKELFDANDPTARELALDTCEKLYKERGIPNPKRYGPDLVFKDFYVECEIKQHWKGKKFPYETIQFPERKVKYLTLDKPTRFFMINKDLTYALIVTNEDMLASPLKMVHNKYVRMGEHFFQVPVSKAQFVKLVKKESK